MATRPQMLVTPPEQPMLCAVCGCTWEEALEPEAECVDKVCPCHHRYWESLDENVKRMMWGDR